uniref:U71-Liphistoxin-Lsp1c_1 n=1 Tax=Liphistius sp. SGP-2016 TaxID=1905180 RepID=A0A4Q8K152_9ARAC
MKLLVLVSSLAVISAAAGDDRQRRSPATPDCTVFPERGPCEESLRRYYYDRWAGICRFFVYGGCQGNGNNFLTEEDCLKTCRVLPPRSACEEPQQDSCTKTFYIRYYYDKKVGHCVRLSIAACPGKENNFRSMEDCEQVCGAQSEERAETESGGHRDCDGPADRGLCEAYMPRFYYDHDEGTCKRFIYGGCGGNGNNFQTEEECNRKCGAVRALKTCTEDSDPGPCRGYFPRFFFNQKTGRCESFVYGGCRGNGNNYETVEECLETCRGLF